MVSSFFFTWGSALRPLWCQRGLQVLRPPPPTHTPGAGVRYGEPPHVGTGDGTLALYKCSSPLSHFSAPATHSSPAWKQPSPIPSHSELCTQNSSLSCALCILRWSPRAHWCTDGTRVLLSCSCPRFMSAVVLKIPRQLP